MDKKPKLSDILVDKLHHAYYHEIENQLIYSRIASWLDKHGLYKLSKYYDNWSAEERNHSEWVKDFLQSVGIELPNTFHIYVDNIEFNDVYSFVDMTVEREDMTTNIYNEIYKLANAESNGLCMEFVMNTMIKEQIEETDKSGTLYDQIHNLKDLRDLQKFDKGYPECYY